MHFSGTWLALEILVCTLLLPPGRALYTFQNSFITFWYSPLTKMHTLGLELRESYLPNFGSRRFTDTQVSELQVLGKSVPRPETKLPISCKSLVHICPKGEIALRAILP